MVNKTTTKTHGISMTMVAMTFPNGIHQSLWSMVSSLMMVLTTVSVSDLAPDWYLEIAIPTIIFVVACATAVRVFPRWLLAVVALVSLGFSVYRGICLVHDWKYELNEDISHGNCGNDENYTPGTVLARVFHIHDPCLLSAIFFIPDTVGLITGSITSVLFVYMMQSPLNHHHDNATDTNSNKDSYKIVDDHLLI